MTGLTLSLVQHLNEETQILGVFIVFVSAVYSKGGEAIGKYFDDVSDQILKEHNAIEDVQIDSSKMLHQALLKQATLNEDVQEIYAIQQQMAEAVVKTHNRKLKHEVRNALQRRLEMAVLAEEREAAEIKSKLVSDSEAHVRAQFTTGANAKKLKNESISAALAGLGGKGSKSTVVGTTYSQYLAQATKDIEKQGKKDTKSALEIQLELFKAEAEAESKAAQLAV